MAPNQTESLPSVEDTLPRSHTPARARQRELPLLHAPRSHAPHSDVWLIAADISRALGAGWHKKKVHRLAKRECWPFRTVANRLEYLPPANIADIVLSAPGSEPSLPSLPSVKFTDLVDGDHVRETALLREAAVQLLIANLCLGKDTASMLVVKHFKIEHPLFPISETSLRRWHLRYEAHGLDGVVEQKRHRVGRKPFVADLEPHHLLQTAAAAIEHGVKGRPNIARAYRNQIVANPTLTGPARRWAHGDHESKSHVPGSVRHAIKQLASPLTTKLLQIGPKAARLDGPYTEMSYDNLAPGYAFTADDMTANAYVWVPWPGEPGWLLIRPQILAAMDIATMRWLCVRAVIRPKGQYNKDDVWGLIGDVIDSFGRFDVAVLEGGSWQSNVVRGIKTELSDDERFGGLQSIGTRVVHTHTPHAKIIETGFNQLQYQADNCRGFCGRMEMKDCPETVRQQLALCRAGKAHPRDFFLSLAQYTDHLTAAMHTLNHERNDGKILHGLTPQLKWDEAPPDMSTRTVPDSAKWMYRSTYNISKVTRNGFTVTTGSGRNTLSYTYCDGAAGVLQKWRGTRVLGFWNDSNPDTDAVIYSIRNNRPHEFLCLAKRVPSLPRFGATEEQSAAEARRKKLSSNVAVTQSRALAPYLARAVPPKSKAQSAPAGHVPSAGDGYDQGISAAIARAKSESAAREQKKADAAKLVSRAIAQAEDLAALDPADFSTDRAQGVSSGASMAELNELFSSEPLPDHARSEVVTSQAITGGAQPGSEEDPYAPF